MNSSVELSNEAQDLLGEIFLHENKESYWKNRFESLSEKEDMMLRGCFEELEDDKFIKVLWGDNIPIQIKILKAGYSYKIQENKIEIIRLENFTVFENFKLELSRGVNIFVGENGTGKTHLLKILYAVCLISSNPNLGGEVLRKCFNEEATANNLLRDNNSPNLFTSVLPETIESKKTFEIQTIPPDIDELRKFNPTSKKIDFKRHILELPQNVNYSATYIPVKDMLTHSKGLLAMASKYRDFPFDKTLTDIIVKASQWKLKQVPKLAKSIIPLLEEMIDGQVIFENEEFYVQKRDGRKVNFAVEAEGLKKIGLLWQLLMTESITENSIILWDEPEANLNPKFLPKLAECLLELSRQNVQIFISTHNYILAKYFNVRAKSTDKILFHSLYFQDGSVTAESNKVFSELKNNAIISTFNELLDEVYDLNIGD